MQNVEFSEEMNRKNKIGPKKSIILKFVESLGVPEDKANAVLILVAIFCFILIIIILKISVNQGSVNISPQQRAQIEKVYEAQKK